MTSHNLISYDSRPSETVDPGDSPYWASVTRMDKTLDYLREAVDTLARKLEVVLTPPGPEAVLKDSAIAPVRATIHAIMSRHDQEVSDVIARLDDLISRVEL